MRKLLARIFVFLIPLLLIFSLAIPVCAIVDPDSIDINSVRAFEGLWEEGDMLFVVEYEVMYAVDPDEEPEDTYLVGIWDGAVKGPDRPLNYYQHNFISIYLDADDVTAFGYEYEDSLSIRVMGNPTYFASLVEDTNQKTLTLTAGHWIAGSTLAETRTYLGNWCITLAGVLETSWEVTLLTTDSKLNTVGMVAFKEAIPGLDSICPDIFQVSASYPSYEEPTYDPVYEESLKDRTGAKLTGILNDLGEFVTGKPSIGSLVGGVCLAILFFILAGRVFIATGSVPTAIVLSIPFLFVGNLIGILPLSITFIAAFLTVVFFGITFILARF